MSNESKDPKNLNSAQASDIADDKDIVPVKTNAKPDAVTPASTAETRSELSSKPTYLTKFPFKFKGRPDGITKGDQTQSNAIKNGSRSLGPSPRRIVPHGRPASEIKGFQGTTVKMTTTSGQPKLK